MPNKPTRKRARLYDDEVPLMPNAYPNGSPRVPRAPAGTGITRMQENFLTVYLGQGISPERAAVAAGVPSTRAYGCGHAWLRDPAVQRRRAELEAESLRRQNIDVDLMMRQLVVRATTPATEAIGDVVVPPCRHCHGINNEYQRTHGEMERDLRKWENTPNDNKPPFDEMGGDGYDYFIPPNPECPNCHGQGDFRHPVHVPVDTRLMSAAGKMLLAGFKVKEGGIEILGRNQDAATLQLLGVLKDMMELRREEQTDVFDLKPPGTATAQIRRIVRVVVDPRGREAAARPGTTPVTRGLP